MMVEGGTATVSLGQYFTDPDGDVLTYGAASTTPAGGDYDGTRSRSDDSSGVERHDGGDGHGAGSLADGDAEVHGRCRER